MVLLRGNCWACIYLELVAMIARYSRVLLCRTSPSIACYMCGATFKEATIFKVPVNTDILRFDNSAIFNLDPCTVDVFRKSFFRQFQKFKLFHRKSSSIETLSFRLAITFMCATSFYLQERTDFMSTCRDQTHPLSS